jgi:hypothetical protein
LVIVCLLYLVEIELFDQFLELENLNLQHFKA